jgi:hypothetical protein
MAQEKEQVTKIIEVRYQDVRSLPQLLQPFGATIQISPELRRVVVTGRSDLVTAVEEAIRKLDVPTPAPKNVEITAYIMMASPQPGGVRRTRGVTSNEERFLVPGFRVLTRCSFVRDGSTRDTTGLGTPPAGARRKLQKTLYKTRFYQVRVAPTKRKCDPMPAWTVRRSPSPPKVDYGSRLQHQIDVQEGQGGGGSQCRRIEQR